MKVKLTKHTYIDKALKPGDIIEVDQTKGDRLIKNNIAEPVKDSIKIKDKPEELTAKDLFNICKEAGLSISKEAIKGKTEKQKRNYFLAVIEEAKTAEQAEIVEAKEEVELKEGE